MRISVRCTSFLIALLLGIATAVLLGTGNAAAAEGSRPPLSVLPDSISLAPNQSAEVTLIAGLPVSGVLTATLTSLRSEDYVVTIQPPQTVVSPSGDVRFTALITRTPTGRSAGQALFALQYSTREQAGGQSTHIITAALHIVDGAPASPALTISLQTVTDTLLDRRSRNAFLLLANTSDSIMRIDDIQAFSEGFVDVVFTPTLTFPLTITAQRSAIVTLTITALDQVQPGNWFVLVKVDSSWERGQRRMQASQFIRSDLGVGVYGENGILQALALPILLFLPGAIFVWLLGKFLPARAQAMPETFKFDFAATATRDFAAATVITSILIVIVYRFAGGIITKVLFGASVARDITLAYGFVDIASIVILAGILAAALAALAIAAPKLVDALVQLQKRIQAYSALKEGDDAQMVIQKLARKRTVFKNLKGWRYTPEGQAKTANVFVLLEDSGQAGKVWVAPGIHLSWNNPTPDAAKAFGEAFKSLNESDAPDDAVKLAALVNEACRRGNLTLEWAVTDLAGTWPALAAHTGSAYTPVYDDERFLTLLSQE